jgi:hypothetical protein
MPLSNVETRRGIQAGLQPASYDMKIGKAAATVPKDGGPPAASNVVVLQDLEPEGH